jgi:DNA-directed RNA polymerase subunit E'/Rpb7
MVVFRPFKGETIQAMITSQTPDGINLKIGDFFNDVFVPVDELPAGVV